MNRSIMPWIPLVCMLLLLSCGKEYERFVPYDTAIYEVGEFFKDLSNDAIQSHGFNTNEETKIITEKSGVITIAPDILVKEDGTLCNCEAQLLIIEAYTLGEIAAFGLPTIGFEGVSAQSNYDLTLLESVGEVFIQIVSENGDILQLKEGEHLKVCLPKTDFTEAFDRWELFLHNSYAWYEEDQDPNIAENVWELEWTNIDGQLVAGYEFSAFQLGWFAVSRYHENSNEKTAVCAEVPIGYNEVNTSTYVFFTDIRSVVDLPNAKEQSFCSTSPFVNVETEALFLSVSKLEENRFAYSFQWSTIDNYHKEVLEPMEVTKEEMISKILSL